MPFAPITMASPFSSENTSVEKKWLLIAVLASLLVGLTSFVIPLHWLTGILCFLAFLTYVLPSPIRSYYLLVYTIPFTVRVREYPIAFTPNDMMAFWCGFICILHAITHRPQVSIRTRFDWGVLAITLLWLCGSIFTPKPNHLLPILKFAEVLITYYCTVYMVRTKQVTRSNALKMLWFTGLCQASIGILQSLTGGFGADFQSQRGYLGYLGLGSSTVWHGMGTMLHFNELACFLVTNILLFLPFFLWFSRKKKATLFLLVVYFFGLITTYSRGGLLALYVSGLFFVYHLMPNRKVALGSILALFFLVILPVITFFANSSYVQTLNFFNRLEIWRVPLTVINANYKNLLFGSGIDSYEIVAWPYIPGNIHRSDYHWWFAHNFYILNVFEFGIFGALLIFGSLFRAIQISINHYLQSRNFRRFYLMSICMYIIAFFTLSIFDHSYIAINLKVYMFFLLAIAATLLPINPPDAYRDARA